MVEVNGEYFYGIVSCDNVPHYAVGGDMTPDTCDKCRELSCHMKVVELQRNQGNKHMQICRKCLKWFKLNFEMRKVQDEIKKLE